MLPQLLLMTSLIFVSSGVKRHDEYFDFRPRSNYSNAHSIHFATDDYRIYIAGLIPMTPPSLPVGGDDHVTEGLVEAVVLPSIQLAMKHVNDDPTVLPGHQLDLIWRDTKVSNVMQQYSF